MYRHISFHQLLSTIAIGDCNFITSRVKSTIFCLFLTKFSPRQLYSPKQTKTQFPSFLSIISIGDLFVQCKATRLDFMDLGRKCSYFGPPFPMGRVHGPKWSKNWPKVSQFCSDFWHKQKSTRLNFLFLASGPILCSWKPLISP